MGENDSPTNILLDFDPTDYHFFKSKQNDVHVQRSTSRKEIENQLKEFYKYSSVEKNVDRWNKMNRLMFKCIFNYCHIYVSRTEISDRNLITTWEKPEIIKFCKLSNRNLIFLPEIVNFAALFQDLVVLLL